LKRETWLNSFSSFSFFFLIFRADDKSQHGWERRKPEGKKGTSKNQKENNVKRSITHTVCRLCGTEMAGGCSTFDLCNEQCLWLLLSLWLLILAQCGASKINR
jgi:hypothetical protein